MEKRNQVEKKLKNSLDAQAYIITNNDVAASSSQISENPEVEDDLNQNMNPVIQEFIENKP